MTRSTTKYTIVHASGQIETAVIPNWLADCHEIARRLPHSLVFMHLKPKHSVFAETPLSPDAIVNGPAIIYASADGRRVKVDHAPTSEQDATQIYFSEVANNRHAA